MGFRFPKNTLFAYLGHDDVPVYCRRKRASAWWASADNQRRSCIKSDEIGNWQIITSFQRASENPDFPLFWQVSWWAENPWRDGVRLFGTKEAALEFHEAHAGYARLRTRTHAIPIP